MKVLQIAKAVQFLQKNGYALIPNFISGEKCEQAMNEINRLVDAFEPTEDQITIFGGDSGKAHRSSKYFMDSADKVSFFFQPKAWQDGKLIAPKRESINKIGHSLHQHNQIFQSITYAQGVQQLCQKVGITRPLVMQSMAILKPPRIGGRITMHQDSTYLYCEPDTLLGFWVPLQDATVKNGCLWGLPGSHKGKLYSRSKVINGALQHDYHHQKDYREEDFIPLEMKRGTLAVFTGKFLHKSDFNTSNVSRYAYTWHLMDETSKWSPQNWLQRPTFPKFPLGLHKK